MDIVNKTIVVVLTIVIVMLALQLNTKSVAEQPEQILPVEQFLDCWKSTDDTPAYFNGEIVPLAEETDYCLVIPDTTNWDY